MLPTRNSETRVVGRSKRQAEASASTKTTARKVNWVNSRDSSELLRPLKSNREPGRLLRNRLVARLHRSRTTRLAQRSSGACSRTRTLIPNAKDSTPSTIRPVAQVKRKPSFAPIQFCLLASGKCRNSQIFRP